MHLSRRKIGGVNRTVALVLATIWLCAGIAALLLGHLHGRWLLAALGAFALWYASLWLRVATRRRLLTWSELFIPWRTP